jgi:hypothetical protein
MQLTSFFLVLAGITVIQYLLNYSDLEKLTGKTFDLANKNFAKTRENCPPACEEFNNNLNASQGLILLYEEPC